MNPLVVARDSARAWNGLLRSAVSGGQGRFLRWSCSPDGPSAAAKIPRAVSNTPDQPNNPHDWAIPASCLVSAHDRIFGHPQAPPGKLADLPTMAVVRPTALRTGIIVSAGYEGRSIEDFVRAMKRNRVELVVDVRLNAVSRKKGFSKAPLTKALAAEGIGYRHETELGNPLRIGMPSGRAGPRLATTIDDTSITEPPRTCRRSLISPPTPGLRCFASKESTRSVTAPALPTRSEVSIRLLLW